MGSERNFITTIFFYKDLFYKKSSWMPRNRKYQSLMLLTKLCPLNAGDNFGRLQTECIIALWETDLQWQRFCQISTFYIWMLLDLCKFAFQDGSSSFSAIFCYTQTSLGSFWCTGTRDLQHIKLWCDSILGNILFAQGIATSTVLPSTKKIFAFISYSEVFLFLCGCWTLSYLSSKSMFC